MIEGECSGEASFYEKFTSREIKNKIDSINYNLEVPAKILNYINFQKFTYWKIHSFKSIPQLVIPFEKPWKIALSSQMKYWLSNSNN